LVTKNKKTIRKKHVPQRTCVGCRTVEPKMTLVRIVRSPEGVQIDPSGKFAGRGAYIHQRFSCWQRAAKGNLAKALRTDLKQAEIERLQEYFEAYADPPPDQTQGQSVERQQS
jgi:hypothetical protein